MFTNRAGLCQGVNPATRVSSRKRACFCGVHIVDNIPGNTCIIRMAGVNADDASDAGDAVCGFDGFAWIQRRIDVENVKTRVCFTRFGRHGQKR